MESPTPLRVLRLDRLPCTIYLREKGTLQISRSVRMIHIALLLSSWLKHASYKNHAGSLPPFLFPVHFCLQLSECTFWCVIESFERSPLHPAAGQCNKFRRGKNCFHQVNC